MDSFKSRAQIAEALNLTEKQLKRRLFKLEIELPPGMVSPVNQKIIYEAFVPFNFENGVKESPDTKQNGTGKAIK